MPILRAVPAPDPAQAITAVVLAGGRGSRMGGADKGLQTFRGQPLVHNALFRLQAQNSRVPSTFLISANRNAWAYANLGAEVLPDSLPDFQGPLAGFLTALQHCETPYLLTVPCDCPLFPLDLVERLWTALQDSASPVAVAWAPEPDAQGGRVERIQPVFCLMGTEVRDSLEQYLRDGGRKIETWAAAVGAAVARFEDAQAFANANTREELQRLERD